MALTRDHEIWAMALWVEKHHGANGYAYIAGRIATLAAEGAPGGVALWNEVEQCYSQLRAAIKPVHGQPRHKQN
jgi:hypothetical protein